MGDARPGPFHRCDDRAPPSRVGIGQGQAVDATQTVLSSSYAPISARSISDRHGWQPLTLILSGVGLVMVRLPEVSEALGWWRVWGSRLWL